MQQERFRLVAVTLRRLGAMAGTILITVGLFLVLPFLQTISKPPAKDLMVRDVDVADLPLPPPPPPEEEKKQEEEEPPEPPQLTEEAPPLDLDQLSLALNPTLGDGLAGDFAPKLIKQMANGANGSMDDIFSLSDLDQKPRVVFQVMPRYPQDLRRKNKGGTVYVVFQVDTTGRVTSPAVEKSTDPSFDQPALEAVKQWRFEPGTRQGEKVRFKMRVPISFSAS